MLKVGALVVLATVLAPQLRPAQPIVRLITLGKFHGGEAKVANGSSWLGLTPTDDGLQWRPMRIVTKTVKDECIDQEGQRTGVEVGVVGSRPLFLVQGLIPPKSPVKTCMYAPDGFTIPDDSEIEFPCHGVRGYGFRVIYRQVEYHGAVPVQLWLDRYEGKQLLFEWPNESLDPHNQLIWAGDLDGDGHMDLLMDLSEHYDVTQWTLFLSSGRRPGNFLEKVAVFRTIGC